jgi:hypothetical protein
LFADLAGFTALTEDHGEEQAADLAHEFSRAAAELLPVKAQSRSRRSAARSCSASTHLPARSRSGSRSHTICSPNAAIPRSASACTTARPCTGRTRVVAPQAQHAAVERDAVRPAHTAARAEVLHDQPVAPASGAPMTQIASGNSSSS